MEKLIQQLEDQLESAEYAKDIIDKETCDYVRGSCNGAIHGLKLALIHAKHAATMENLERQRLKAFYNCD